EYCDGQQPGYAGYSIIYPRSDTRVALLYRAHHCCCERCDCDGHAEAHHHHRREKGGPETAWATCDTRHGKKSKAERGDDRANHQWQLRAKTIHQPTGPTRKQKHDQAERHKGSTSKDRRIPLNLNEIEG